MAVLALLVSIVALIASGFSAWYTKRQARANEGVLIIEEQRELERQRPTIVARFERVGTIHFLLVVENRGVKQVSVIFYVADQREGLGFNPPHVKESFMRLKPGIPETVDFRAESLPEDGVVRFLVVFRDGNDQWEQLVDVPVPPTFAVV